MISIVVAAFFNCRQYLRHNESIKILPHHVIAQSHLMLFLLDAKLFFPFLRRRASFARLSIKIKKTLIVCFFNHLELFIKAFTDFSTSNTHQSTNKICQASTYRPQHRPTSEISFSTTSSHLKTKSRSHVFSDGS